jgi:ribose transport system permease protein
MRFLLAPLLGVLTILAFAPVAPGYLTFDNLASMAAQAMVLALLALGQSLALVTRGFDLSVGAIASLAGVAAAAGANLLGPVGLVAGPLVGLAAGLCNGVLIGPLGLQPVVATLGTLLGLRGISLLVTDGGQVLPLEDSALAAGLAFSPALLGLPVTFWGSVGIALAVGWVLTSSLPGRRLVMVGSDPAAAALVGVGRTRALLWAYGGCGMLAGCAGVAIALRAGGGLPTDGAGLELQSIAAALIGGTALTGGVVRAGAVVAGAAFIQILVSGLNLLGVSPFAAQVATGFVLIAAGILDAAAKRIRPIQPNLKGARR